MSKPLADGRAPPARAESQETAGGAGLLAGELADHCGLHRTYISGIERGVRNPTVVILDKIAKGLMVPAGVLLEEAKASTKKS